MAASIQRSRHLSGVREHPNQAAIHKDNQLRPALEGMQEMLQCHTIADRCSTRRSVTPARCSMPYFSSILNVYTS